MKVQKKPVIVDALQFTGPESAGEISQLIGQRRFRLVTALPDEEVARLDPGTDAQVYDVYHATWIGIRYGQWIIRGVKGEAYPIEDDVLRGTYILDEAKFLTLDE